VASFGFRYDYAQQRLQPAQPIPDRLGPLIENRGLWRARRRRSRRCCAPKMTVGVVIGWHRDKPQFDRPLAWIALQVPFPAAGRRKCSALRSSPRQAFST